MDHALRDIYDERQRQVTQEGWTPEHDDTHVDGELALAAALYAIPYQNALIEQDDFIGLHMALENGHGWNLKPDKDPRRRLVKAGALILAEIQNGCNTSYDISEETGLSVAIVSTCVSELIKAGQLRRTGNYIPHPRGQKYLCFEPVNPPHPEG